MLRDHDAVRAYLSVSLLLATPDEMLARPGLRDRVLALGLAAPLHPRRVRAAPPRGYGERTGPA